VLRERAASFPPAKIGALNVPARLCGIKAGGDAAKCSTNSERDPAFDLENRWQAECSSRAISNAGRSRDRQALARITALLLEPARPGRAVKPICVRA